jgi:hypothetical protein
MKFKRFSSSFLACLSLLTATTILPTVAEVPVKPTLKIAQLIAPPKCDPHVGGWRYQDTGFSLSRVSARTNTLKVRMTSFGRSIPVARGRILSPTQIEVDFPAVAGTFIKTPGTYIGTLNGQGKISWSNGTEWEATEFMGSWFYERGKSNLAIGPSRSGGLTINMNAYGRPPATGYKTSASQAVFQFPDDATHTATLVSPSCMKWSNGTIWVR